MKVLDASFLVKLVLEEERSEEAERLIKEWILEGEEVATLDLAFPESFNALCKRAVKGELSQEECREAAEDLYKILSRIRVYQSREFILKAVDISLEHGITVYDSLYLSLAADRGGDLATFDEELGRVAAKLGVTTRP